MKIPLFLAVIMLFLTHCSSASLKYSEAKLDTNNYYENYDDDLLESLDLDDEAGSDLNVIGRENELRQIILNPRKRRERRRKHQGKMH